MTLDVDTNMWR